MRDILVIEKLEKNLNKLICNVREKNEQKTLWISVEENFAKYLCDDRADVFFIYCVYKAIKEGYDLVSKVPVSGRLVYQTKRFLAPVLAKVLKVAPIKIDVPSTFSSLSSQNAVGTGVTLGVDSMFSIATHINSPEGNGFNLTHLVLMNVGSHSIGAEDELTLWENRISKAREFCKENNFEFVKIDTNVRDFFSYDYTEYHGLINQATILALQPLFRYYYTSSSYMMEEFGFNPDDFSQFELFNLAMLETEATSFYSVGGEISRYDKVKLLVNYPPSYKYLNVCNSYSDNCSKTTCVKCMRTILELDALNALDKYASVFDIQMYESNKMTYLSDMYARKVLRHDHYAIEMWDDLMKKYRIPLWQKIKGLYRFISSRLRIYNLKYIRYRLKGI